MASSLTKIIKEAAANKIREISNHQAKQTDPLQARYKKNEAEYIAVVRKAICKVAKENGGVIKDRLSIGFGDYAGIRLTMPELLKRLETEIAAYDKEFRQLQDKVNEEAKTLLRDLTLNGSKATLPAIKKFLGVK